MVMFSGLSDVSVSTVKCKMKFVMFTAHFVSSTLCGRKKHHQFPFANIFRFIIGMLLVAFVLKQLIDLERLIYWNGMLLIKGVA